MKNIFKQLKEKLPFPLILIFILIAPFYLTIGCPIQFLTGISCFGCGMSRAAIALLQLDFALAFKMHPMIFVMPIAALVILFRKKIPKKVLNGFWVTVAVLMAVIYVYRLIAGSDVIYVNPESGYIYQIIKNIFFN